MTREHGAMSDARIGNRSLREATDIKPETYVYWFARKAKEFRLDGLAGFCAHNSAGGAGRDDPGNSGAPYRLLDCLLTLALEIPDRSRRRAAHCSAADRAGLLRSGRPGSTRSPLGRWWEALTGHTLAFTFEGLVIGSIIYSLPFAVQPFAASFAAVDRRLIAASATLGASRLRTFFRVILPLSLSGLVTGAALSFAHTMGEFGVVLMVGGNIPGVTRTVSIDI